MGGFAPNTEINANTDIISHRKKEQYHRVEMNYRLGRSTGAFGAELNIGINDRGVPMLGLITLPTICNNVPNPRTTRTSVILVHVRIRIRRVSNCCWVVHGPTGRFL